MTIPHTSGTITLTQNSAAIVGTLTSWQTAGVTGGIIYPEAPGGNPLPILDILSDTAATAAVKWKGASGTYPYALVKDTAYLKTIDAIHTTFLEVSQDFDRPSVAALAAIAGQMATGKVPRGLSPETMEWFTVSEFAKSLLDDADAAAMRITLGNVFAKNQPMNNDVLSGNAADFNALPGTGPWLLDRGSNLPCLNAPPDVSKFAYRAVQIGDAGRGSQIAFNYSEGPMWIRNGLNGWGAWRLVPSSLQSITIGASGGSESDLQTVSQVYLSVNFVARAMKVFAVANWCFNPTINSTLEAFGIILLRDVSLGADVKWETSAVTLSAGDNGMGYRAGRGVSLTYDTLTLGNTYQLQLVMYKNQPIGPIYPRQMSINAHNF